MFIEWAAARAFRAVGRSDPRAAPARRSSPAARSAPLPARAFLSRVIACRADFALVRVQPPPAPPTRQPLDQPHGRAPLSGISRESSSMPRRPSANRLAVGEGRAVVRGRLQRVGRPCGPNSRTPAPGAFAPPSCSTMRALSRRRAFDERAPRPPRRRRPPFSSDLLAALQELAALEQRALDHFRRGPAPALAPVAASRATKGSQTTMRGLVERARRDSFPERRFRALSLPPRPASDPAPSSVEGRRDPRHPAQVDGRREAGQIGEPRLRPERPRSRRAKSPRAESTSPHGPPPRPAPCASSETGPRQAGGPSRGSKPPASNRAVQLQHVGGRREIPPARSSPAARAELGDPRQRPPAR